MFEKVEPAPNFPEIELKILRFWRDTDAFNKRRSLNLDGKRWSFLDGPITANNPMGLHHARARMYKDLFQRFQSMQGKQLRYQNGFDCQGLWVEVEVEKELGFKTKREIETYGVAEFVKRCKQRALNFAAIQTEQSIRLGNWMDWDDPEELRRLAKSLDNSSQITYGGTTGSEVTGTAEQIVGKLGDLTLGGSYFTMSDANNYAIWAFLKRCNERGWIYKGTDVMPWCPRCSTALSEHEIATEGYQELVHSAVTLKFPLRGRPGESILVWTTTPWTLSSNVAAAVNPDLIYVKVKHDGEILYIAKAALARYGIDAGSVLQEMRGEDLLNLVYDGPFDELPAVKESGANTKHFVIPWKDVSETDGTGFVHIAPGCGKEDFELGREYKLPSLSPLNEYGVFIENYGKFTGMHVYDTPEFVFSELKSKGLLFRVEKYKHRYPVCWRCGSELIFRLVDEWFISMGKKLEKPFEELSEEEKENNLRYQIMDVTKQIRWIPEFGMSMELDWLRNMSDWMISKKRYWGLALPIWECKKCKQFEVIGGKEQLKERAVEGWSKFEGHSPHRPWIDEVKIQCRKCGGTLTRISDVGNPWLDAGIVAYSTMSYFSNRSYWDAWFPADFICEALPGQFRNWFYSLLAMSTVLEKRQPCRVCFGHGNVLAEDGREMHKSLGTAIWFDDAAKRIGADIIRWMYAAAKVEPNMRFGYKLADDVKRRFLLPLWNVYSFFITYASLDNWRPEERKVERSPLDRWILSKLQTLIGTVTSDMEDYNAEDACAALEEFVDDLSKWYVRRSRRRFWKSEADADKEAAYSTLYTVLVAVVELLAPFIPFVTEEIYQNLVRGIDPQAPPSVHHNTWPAPKPSLVDKELEQSMDMALDVCNLGHAARNTSGIKVRQPLQEVVVVAEREKLNHLFSMGELLKDELNVKRVELIDDKAKVVGYQVTLRPQSGAKYGRLFPALRSVLDSMDHTAIAESLKTNSSLNVNVRGQAVTLAKEDLEISTKAKPGFEIAEGEELIVAIDTALTEDL
ncbi:MAG TPA: class I tRNA ligase family protein, partial [Terriglobales bacterium]|nr:class I tRNA ligase family protein [Terriglobales bacterium]